LKKDEYSISLYAIPGTTIKAIKTTMKGHNNKWDATAGTAFTGAEEIENSLL